MPCSTPIQRRPGWRCTGGVTGAWRALPSLDTAAEHRRGDSHRGRSQERAPLAWGMGELARACTAGGERCAVTGRGGKAGHTWMGGLDGSWTAPEDGRPGWASLLQVSGQWRGLWEVAAERELRGPAGRPVGRAGPPELLPGSQGRRGPSVPSPRRGCREAREPDPRSLRLSRGAGGAGPWPWSGRMTGTRRAEGAPSGVRRLGAGVRGHWSRLCRMPAGGEGTLGPLVTAQG